MKLKKAMKLYDIREHERDVYVITYIFNHRFIGKNDDHSWYGFCLNEYEQIDKSKPEITFTKESEAVAWLTDGAERKINELPQYVVIETNDGKLLAIDKCPHCGHKLP